MKKLCILLLVAAAALPAFAITDDTSQNPNALYPNAVGIYMASPPLVPLMLLDGIADLHYQRWLGKLGASVSGGWLYDPDDGTYSASAILGISLDLYGSAWTSWLAGSLYAVATAGYAGYADSFGGVYNGFELGLGIGLETVVLKHFSFPLEALFLYRSPLLMGFTIRIAPRYRF